MAELQPDPTRRIPSDCLPTNVAEAADDDNSEWMRRFIRRKPDARFEGPHAAALGEYLGRFVGTPYERQVWNRYFDFSRPPADEWPTIERAAAKAGLSEWEYIAQKTLEELKRYVKANGIPETISPVSVAYSKHVQMKALREDLGISHNTLKKMLVWGSHPVEGRIRYIAAKASSRIIQVAIDDLPAKLKAKYRP